MGWRWGETLPKDRDLGQIVPGRLCSSGCPWNDVHPDVLLSCKENVSKTYTDPSSALQEKGKC